MLIDNFHPCLAEEQGGGLHGIALMIFSLWTGIKGRNACAAANPQKPLLSQHKENIVIILIT